MLFRQLFDYESYTYTYLIASSEGQDAILIDPVKRQIANYLNLLSQLDLRLVAALDTHLHADHITGLGELKAQTGCLMMMGAQSQADCVDKRFSDNEQLDWQGPDLTSLYTPGHTDDSYCFLMKDRVFTGDTLFIRGTGRTDFQHGDAGLQFDSIQNRLLSLPDETLVYPGHDYTGMTVSTIGEERRFNPRLQVNSREAYIAQMNGLDLPTPKLMHIAVPANKRCGLDS